MNEEDLLKALEEYAGSRDQFSLREFRDWCCPGHDIKTLLVQLLPALSRKRLGWRGSGRDYHVFRIPPRKEIGTAPDNAPAPAPWRPDLTGLPEVIEEYIGYKTQKPWNDPVTLQRIRAAVMQQKGQYWKEGDSRRIGYRKGYAVIAYLAYHALVSCAQFQHAFMMLVRDGLIPAQARILDVGTGPGVVPLAIAACARRLSGFSAEIFSLERSDEFLEAYRFLLPRYLATEPAVTWYPPVQGDLRNAESLLLPSSLDLIVLQNVTNELVQESAIERAGRIRMFARLLVPGGCMVIIEPAELRNATALREMVQAAIGPDLQLHSPCTFLWGGTCGADRCWSFVEKPPVSPTRLMRALAGDHEGYRFLNTDIKFSYAVLVNDGRKRHQYTIPHGSHLIRLSALKTRLGRHVQVAGSLMSADLGEGKTHVFLFCDGTSRQPVYVVMPHFHLSAKNQILLSLPYGSIVGISDALVRFNQKHGAWNLFLTRRSRVTPISRAPE
ncbi:MAG: class I SAM-dependent methyltransferase [Methanoregulaceae archaeon]|jgi:hypothetical protein